MKAHEKLASLSNRFHKDSYYDEQRKCWDMDSRLLKRLLIHRWHKYCDRHNRTGHINELSKKIDCLEVLHLLRINYGHTCSDGPIMNKLLHNYSDKGPVKPLEKIAEELHDEVRTELF